MNVNGKTGKKKKRGAGGKGDKGKKAGKRTKETEEETGPRSEEMPPDQFSEHDFDPDSYEEVFGNEAPKDEAPEGEFEEPDDIGEAIGPEDIEEMEGPEDIEGPDMEEGEEEKP